MLTCLLLLTTVTPSDLPADTAEKMIADERRKLQGSWKVVRVEPADRKVDGEEKVVIFKDDTITSGDRPAVKYKLDPTQDPKWFDMDMGKLFGPNEKEFYAPGIYLLDGDKLTLAIVTEANGKVFKPRPKNFKDKFPGVILHLERIKP